MSIVYEKSDIAVMSPITQKLAELPGERMKEKFTRADISCELFSKPS